MYRIKALILRKGLSMKLKEEYDIQLLNDLIAAYSPIYNSNNHEKIWNKIMRDFKDEDLANDVLAALEDGEDFEEDDLYESTLNEAGSSNILHLTAKEVDRARKYYQDQANDYFDAEEMKKSDDYQIVVEFLWILKKFLSYYRDKEYFKQAKEMALKLYEINKDATPLADEFNISSDTKIEMTPDYLAKLTSEIEGDYKGIYDKFVTYVIPYIEKKFSSFLGNSEEPEQSKKTYANDIEMVRDYFKMASKKSKVKILKNGWFDFVHGKGDWLVTLDTEDESDADRFRNELDDLLDMNSGAHSYDDIIGLGDVHIGTATQAEISEDSYGDLDPKGRDKYVVYCEPASDYKRRREMDW